MLNMYALFFFVLFLAKRSDRRVIGSSRGGGTALCRLVCGSASIRKLYVTSSVGIRAAGVVTSGRVMRAACGSVCVGPASTVSVTGCDLLMLYILSLNLVFVSFGRGEGLCLTFNDYTLSLLVIVLSPIGLSVTFFVCLVLVSLVLLCVTVKLRGYFRIVGTCQRVP